MKDHDDEIQTSIQVRLALLEQSIKFINETLIRLENEINRIKYK
jgi:hypothetical protein